MQISNKTLPYYCILDKVDNSFNHKSYTQMLPYYYILDKIDNSFNTKVTPKCSLIITSVNFSKLL